jgi:hypothetical protein
MYVIYYISKLTYGPIRIYFVGLMPARGRIMVAVIRRSFTPKHMKNWESLAIGGDWFSDLVNSADRNNHSQTLESSPCG